MTKYLHLSNSSCPSPKLSGILNVDGSSDSRIQVNSDSEIFEVI